MPAAGHPTACRREFCELARTIDNWIASHPAFADAVRAGRVVADARVTCCLHERAVGYSCGVECTVLHDRKARTLKNVVHYPPDTRASMFWLRNRRRDAWSEKRAAGPEGGSYSY